MPDTRRTWTTTEYSTLKLPADAEADLDLLGSLPDELIRLRRGPDGWTLETGAVCGVLELHDHRLVVEPRLFADGAAVVRWIAYGEGITIPIDRNRAWRTNTDGLPEVVAGALASECARLLVEGLRRDYRRDQDEDTVLRGRLDHSRQISKRFGQIDRLYLDRFERRTDVVDNLVCRAALDVAGRIVLAPETRRRVRDIARDFPEVPRTFDARRAVARLHHHRLNARYGAAHTWAALLLSGGGVSDLIVPGLARAGSLLIQTARVWERVVARLCRDAGGSALAGPRSIVVSETGRSGRTFRPDAVLLSPDGSTIPVDAKYKDYASLPLASADAHQLLTYADAYRLAHDAPARSVVVYPTLGQGPGPRAVGVRVAGRSLGTIAVLGVSTSADPADALVVLRGL